MVNPTLFARFLAKITHGYAVAHLGMDGFRPYLPPIILMDTEDPFRYVGGYSEPPPNSEALHQVTQGYAELNGTKFVLIRMRLFALLGAPEYLVVAGDCDLATLEAGRVRRRLWEPALGSRLVQPPFNIPSIRQVEKADDGDVYEREWYVQLPKKRPSHSHARNQVTSSQSFAMLNDRP